MNRDSVIIVDAETSGPDVFENDLLSLYMSTLDGKHTLELYVKYKAELKWGSVAKRYFNIYKPQWEKNATGTDVAIKRINQYLDSINSDTLFMAGHNVAFDLGFIRKLSRTAGVALSSKLSHRVIDTHSILALKVLQGKLPQYTLKPQGAAEYFGIKSEQRHFAKDDAELIRDLLGALIDNQDGKLTDNPAGQQ